MRPDPIRKQLQSQTKASAVVGIVFGLVFFGMGISVMLFVWTERGFGAPPLFMRIFATLIAIPFVAVGGMAAYGSVQALRGNPSGGSFAANLLHPTATDEALDDAEADDRSSVQYTCPACGAPLARGAEVSPHGDVKCTHCGGWFNVHKSSA